MSHFWWKRCNMSIGLIQDADTIQNLNQEVWNQADLQPKINPSLHPQSMVGLLGLQVLGCSSANIWLFWEKESCCSTSGPGLRQNHSSFWAFLKPLTPELVSQPLPEPVYQRSLVECGILWPFCLSPVILLHPFLLIPVLRHPDGLFLRLPDCFILGGGTRCWIVLLQISDCFGLFNQNAQ